MTSEEPTTPDDLERTRGVYALLNSRDFDALIARFGPASVWDLSRWGLGTKEGLDAIGHFLEDWFGSLDEYHVQVEEIHDLGEGVVRVVVVQSARRAGSRGLLEMRSAPVFLWVDGRIARVTIYRDVGEARVAAERLAEARRP